MRIPANSFDDADRALCRAHGNAVSALVKSSDVREPSAADHNLGLACWLMELDAAKRQALYQKEAKPSAAMQATVDLVQQLADNLCASNGAALIGAKQPEPAADVWHSEAPSVAGVYLTRRGGMEPTNRHWDGEVWSCGSQYSCKSTMRQNGYDRRNPTEWARLIEADAPAAKQAQATHRVCIRAYATSFGCQWSVGQLSRGEASDFELPNNWLPCDKDGWITHEPQSDSVCPVPGGVRFENLRRDGTVCLFGDTPPEAWKLGHKHSRTASSGDIVAWRPTGAAA